LLVKMNFSRPKSKDHSRSNISNSSSNNTATPKASALMQWFPKATGLMLQKMACGCSGDMNINDHIVAEDDEHDMFDDVSVLDSHFYEGDYEHYEHYDYKHEQQQQQQQYKDHAAPVKKFKSKSSSSQQQQHQPPLPAVYHLSEGSGGQVSHHAPLNGNGHSNSNTKNTSTSCKPRSSRKSPVSPVPSYATASTATMQTFEDVDLDDEHDDDRDYHDYHHENDNNDDEEEEEVRSTASTQVISHLLKATQSPKSTTTSRSPNNNGNANANANAVSPNLHPYRASEIPTSGDAYRVLLRMPPRQPQSQSQSKPLPPPSLHSLPRNSNLRPRVRSTPARHNQRDLDLDLPPLPRLKLQQPELSC
jgi:hypothetical protein